MKRIALVVSAAIWANACTPSPTLPGISDPSASYLVRREIETSGNAVLCRYTRGETVRLENLTSACPPIMGAVPDDRSRRER